MSLQHLAQQVQSRGRGDDSVLVHMTPNEVNGLQALALAHGGSLSINPETGLPEASFLSSILPMVAGALLAPMTAGTSLAWMGSPMGAALTVGGLTGLATGSLNKGFMAGLGAFGGAGLGAGLMGAGASGAANAANAANAATTTGSAAARSAPIFTKNLVGGGVQGGVANSAGFSGVGNLNAALPASVSTPALTSPIVNPSLQQMTAQTGMATPLQEAAKLGARTFPSSFDEFKYGFKAIGENPVEGIKAVWENMPTGSGLASALSLANAARPDYKGPKKTKALIRPYTLNRNYEPAGHGDTGYGTSERRYFDDQYTALEPYEAPGPEYAANGGLMGVTSFASGGYNNYPNNPYANYPYNTPPEEEEEDTSQKIIDPYKYDYDRETGLFVQKSGPGTPSSNAIPDAVAQQNAMITNTFQKYLGRAPEQSALDFYREGQTTQDALAKDIMGSAEYKENLTRPLNRNVINAAYRDVLRRDVDEPGFQSYSVAGLTPDDLRRQLMESEEYKARQQQLINREQADKLYQELLGRSIDPEGLKSYVDANSFTPDELRAELLKSPEYKKREGSFATKTQITNLYKDILRRPADAAALEFYGKENRMTPADLKRTLMNSDEYLELLTKPLVPKPQVDQQTGRVSIAGAMRTPEQEAARPRDMSGFYAMMNKELKAQGGYAVGGPVEQMSAMNAIGGNLMYPQSQLQTPVYSNPMVQRPIPSNVISHGLDAPVDPYSGEQRLAGGGISNLGGFSDGGRLLKGPGDGVSDSIPAVIGQRQPARLADGEFVIPARIVSELGNGSTEAGARKLYAMMDRVQKARKKSVGKNRVAVNSKADKYLPA